MNARPVPSATPASLWLRLLAATYDALPVLALAFLASVLALAFTAGGLDVRRFADKLLVQALVLAFAGTYFVLSWSRGGQTIGMKPWHLRVVSADGRRASVRQATTRFAVALVSLAAAGLGFWWALLDPQKRTWHDLAAGTLVVRLDPS